MDAQRSGGKSARNDYAKSLQTSEAHERASVEEREVEPDDLFDHDGPGRKVPSLTWRQEKQIEARSKATIRTLDPDAPRSPGSTSVSRRREVQEPAESYGCGPEAILIAERSNDSETKANRRARKPSLRDLSVQKSVDQKRGPAKRTVMTITDEEYDRIVREREEEEAALAIEASGLERLDSPYPWEGQKRLIRIKPTRVPDLGRRPPRPVRPLAEVIRDFLAEECVVGPDRKVGVRQLYYAFEDWCVRTNAPEPTGLVTGARFASVLKRCGCRQDGHGSWVGLGFLECDDESGCDDEYAEMAINLGDEEPEEDDTDDSDEYLFRLERARTRFEDLADRLAHEEALGRHPHPVLPPARSMEDVGRNLAAHQDRVRERMRRVRKTAAALLPLAQQEVARAWAEGEMNPPLVVDGMEATEIYGLMVGTEMVDQNCQNPNGCPNPIKGKSKSGAKCGPCHEYARTHRGAWRSADLIEKEQRRRERRRAG